MQKNQLPSLFVVTLSAMYLWGSLSTPPGHLRAPSAAKVYRPSQSSEAVVKWAQKKAHDISAHLAERGTPQGPPDFWDFHVPEREKDFVLSSEQRKVAAATKALYDAYFPPNDPASLIGTFFESGHPYIQTKNNLFSI